MPFIQDASIQNMKICIVGAGMGGLTCALALAKAGFQDIEVYEFASDLGFVGAGIQMAPNMARILHRLRGWDEIAREGVVLNSTSIREGATDSELASLDLKYIKETYGYPHMVGHRATLAKGLYDGCLKYDTIKFIFGTDVSDAKFGDHPSFTATVRKTGESL